MPWSVVVVVVLTLVFAPSTIRAAENQDGGAAESSATVPAPDRSDGGIDTGGVPPAPPGDVPSSPGPAAAAPEQPGSPAVAAPAMAPNPDQEWPLEYVKRPMTVPEGMIVLGAHYQRLRLSDPLSPAIPLPPGYFSVDKAGFSLGVGLARDVQIGLVVRGLLCSSPADPSSCDDGNRHAGTGFSATVAVLRRADRHLAVTARAGKNGNRRVGLDGLLGVAGKMLLGQRVALESSLSATHALSSQQGVPTEPLLASLGGGVNLQLTRRLNTWVDATVSGPLGDMFSDGPRLSVGAGASAMLGNILEVGASWRRWNPGSTPAWDRTVPGTVISLFLQLFIATTPAKPGEMPTLTMPRAVFPVGQPPLQPINIPHPFEPVPVGP